MASRRYTILIADRTSGVVRRVTISARPAVAVACAMVTLPVLIGVGAAWKAKSDVGGLYASQQALELENASFRTATSELSGQIESLQSAITDLGAQAALDPSLARTMEKLPALVKSRAMGGNVTPAETTKQQESTYARTLASDLDHIFGVRLQSLVAYPGNQADGSVHSCAIVDGLGFRDLVACLPDLIQRSREGTG